MSHLSPILYVKFFPMKHILLTLLAFAFVSFSQAQCVIDTLVPRVPGIYPDSIPPFTGCNYGEIDVTFVFPRDTTTTIAGQTVTVPFFSFTINGVAGLPQGMGWQCDLQPNCFYDLAPGTADPDTIGCIRLFGTPTIPGVYPISVLLTVDVQLIGNVNTTYDALLTVEPCVFFGSCYTLALSDNCEPAMLDLTNNIPANGNPGYSYSWDVQGPGGFQYQTSDENPTPQMLPQAGEYTVDYELMVDTIGFLLDSVVIDSVNCGDFLVQVEPDIYWIFTDPSGTQLANTSASPLNDFDDFPLNIGYPRTLLDTGTYTLEVWDNDITSPDDGCADGQNLGSAAVSISNPPPRAGANVVINNGLQVTFYFSNPISTVTCSDTFHIDSLPAAPDIQVMTDTFFCAGDSVALTVAGPDSIQWYFNNLPITGTSDTMIWAKEAGRYQAVRTSNASRCSSPLSTAVMITEVSVAPPGISLSGTSFSILSPNPQYTYEWFKDGTMVGSGNTFDATLSGVYWAVAIDNQTACRSDTSANVQLIMDGLDDLTDLMNGFKLFPNPTSDLVTIEMEMLQAEAVELRLVDMMGRVLQQKMFTPRFGQISHTFDLRMQPAGIYLLQLTVAGKRASGRIVKR